jgi:hypothetical protein
LIKHATDLSTWGLFWPVLAGVLWARLKVAPTLGGIRATLVMGIAMMFAVTVLGPERIRAFAESGTLLNRLLLQLWPTAFGALWLSHRSEPFTDSQEGPLHGSVDGAGPDAPGVSNRERRHVS